ncbi:MAG TPA: CehA/McbA family metallohydrolase [Thermomicrobiaceae bacterium]|nr:CehA/McbA family metallohydrolase [Thermomicrobiaceae bacterium]
MHSLPFDKPGRFYRGNLHTHSTASDGGLEPGAVVAAYRERGYDFLVLSEHFMAKYGFPILDTAPWRDERFTTLIGAELHAPSLENGAPWHILAVGLPLDFAPTASDETGPALAARARGAGAFIGLAHPHWYGLTQQDALSVEAAHAVEIYNTGCAVEVDRGEGWYLADLLLQRGHHLLAYATDDAHFQGRPDAFGGWVQVRAERLDPESLLAALKAGHFYSTQGPELHDVRVEGNQLQITCSPVTAVMATGPGYRNSVQYGEAIERCTLPLDRFAGRYCRLTVIDRAGKRAWTNPIWLG